MPDGPSPSQPTWPWDACDWISNRILPPPHPQSVDPNPQALQNKGKLSSVIPVLRCALCAKSCKIYQGKKTSALIFSVLWAGSLLMPVTFQMYLPPVSLRLMYCSDLEAFLPVPGSTTAALPPDTAEVCKWGRMSQSEGVATPDGSLEIKKKKKSEELLWPRGEGVRKRKYFHFY